MSIKDLKNRALLICEQIEDLSAICHKVGLTEFEELCEESLEKLRLTQHMERFKKCE